MRPKMNPTLNLKAPEISWGRGGGIRLDEKTNKRNKEIQKKYQRNFKELYFPKA